MSLDIPLNKTLELEQSELGELSRRIIAKAILKVVSKGVQSAAGPLQTCAGHEGVEATVHAMKNINVNDCTEGILLVDAAKCFQFSKSHSCTSQYKPSHSVCTQKHVSGPNSFIRQRRRNSIVCLCNSTHLQATRFTTSSETSVVCS